MSALGVGLIGTGYMGKCHALAWNAVAPVFGQYEPVRLVSLAEINADFAWIRARELGFEKSTGQWRDLVDDPEIDVISITAPNQFHADMAVTALEAGKHVWCEKPMATNIKDALRMRDAAARSGRSAVLGYNYIQNPIVRQISKVIDDGLIGKINHVRIEMDEDFFADPTARFSVKNSAESGFGALDDFGVHPVSLVQTLIGRFTRVLAHQSKPYDARPQKSGGFRKVETWDVASVLFEAVNDVSGVISLNRAAWGRKGRLALQVFGSNGSILYDQERMNEFQLFVADDGNTLGGFKTILAGPDHAPYDRFVPAAGHGLGFNDLKTIECNELIKLIVGEGGAVIDFAMGFEIERTMHAMALSHSEEGWVSVA